MLEPNTQGFLRMARKTKTRIEPAFSGPVRKPAAQASARRAPSKARRGRGRRRFGWFGRLIYWGAVLGVWGGVALAGVIGYFAISMPSATTWSIPDRPPNIKILAADGALIANRGRTGGEAVGLHDMSPFLPKAVMAIEDRRFYSHFGVDPIGLARAMVTNVTAGRLVQGGSTLTQQLAKNLFLEPERTIERKVQEVLLAFWLEHKFSKDEILELYLNRVYFGSGATGVEAASRRYFSKSARDLDLHEAALLAGLLKAPSRLSPARDPKAAEERAHVVLGAMREAGYIDDSMMTAALSAEHVRVPAFWDGAENYVADRVMDDVEALTQGNIKSDLIVTTTVDLALQERAETAIRKVLIQQGKEKGVQQGALVAMDQTGAIRALVGGKDYAKSQFDRASAARRQPGSTFKPFVYMAALEAGLTPDTIRNDAPVRIGKWTPENYNGKYFGPVTLTTALAKSLNSVSAQLAQEVGPKTVAQAAMRLGISSPLEVNASLALGTSEVTLTELTAAYATFANGGLHAPPRLIQRIEAKDGTVIYDSGAPAAARVMRADIAAMMNRMMNATVEEGTARKADFGWPAAGKTGTSQNSKDAWFIGYTARLTTGVWFGNDDGTPMNKVTGGSLPAEAWRDFMAAAHKGLKPQPLPGLNGAEPATDSLTTSIEQILMGERDKPVPPAAIPDSTTTSATPKPRQTTILDILTGG